MIEFQIEDELPPATRRVFPYLAAALQFWLVEGNPPEARDIFGRSEEQRVRMQQVIDRFSGTIPAADVLVSVS